MSGRKKSEKEADTDNELVILDAPAEIVQPLLNKESEVVFKNLKRDKEFAILWKRVEQFIEEFLRSPSFKKAVCKLLAQNDELDLLNLKILKRIMYNLNPKDEIIYKMESHFLDLWELSKVYGVRVKLRIKENNGISIEQEYGFPNYEFFKAKGRNIERDTTSEESIQNLISFCERIVKFKSIINEIEIQEQPGSSDKGKTLNNPLFEVLSGTSRVCPTIIKYTKHDGVKKMLVSIPPTMDITTFTKEYGALLSKAHRDFYQKQFKGRPETTIIIGKLIHEMWEKKFKGKNYSITKRCQLASAILKQDYKIDLAPITLRRHYLRQIKGGT